MENQTTKKSIIPGECSLKKLGILAIICLIPLVIMCYLCQFKNTANTQPDNQITSLFTSEPEPPEFFLSLVSHDYMQDEISYIPRFVQGKVITYIALAQGDSIVLFSPVDKMTADEYNHWLGRNKAAYEYTTGKVE